MSNKIITPQEFGSFRNISKKLDTEKINESIGLSQSVDLYDVLGDFYFDLISDLENPDYADLLSGCTFTSNNQTFIHDGLKSLLADYTYARFTYVMNVNYTPFGIQSKFTDDSSPVDRNIIKDIIKQTQIDANIKFKMIDKYLLANKGLFPRYKNNNNPDINTFGLRSTVI
ncbi:hypothetical protein [Olleya marilimosa]|uniref:DUF6712 family protein n=1 Tax=Olleya marilimosa TaxID=272164 RepID=UPI0030ED87B9|tara:strand:- start:88644 stop:89156 length:513 start_codon:yes stop_codon:yes gene_type:complete